ncbi:hypothetical protein LGT39_12470 [Demequina sp. TTPB684]|uniref:hypothetical protein n=1 Tax=unclassified Demequina TaxID=2620311 RepID=UPI001CF5EBB5|nr:MULTISPECIES: hypothetical protein [unclassified Demequina]MCB2413659.1 hypothetical protein [Demequina sp. TTPB684]UPU87722.1 hypothetical protein LGT36_010725 [Demequina sp. TMPB413]
MATKGLYLPAPQWGTPRNPQRETLGPQVARVAKLLGWNLMPWQRLVLDVGCELDPATGSFWYRDVRCLVPRQSGKTTIMVSKSTHRALTDPRSRILYTAQDRNKALERLEENFYAVLLERLRPVLEPGANRHKPGWVARTGSERIKFATHSTILIDAIKKSSSHGGTNQEWHADELFAHKDAQAAQNIRPTMITVPSAQIWSFSAAGDKVTSKYLWELVEDGRAIIEASAEGRIAYFEWSDKDPEADREDSRRWYEFMPALGHTIREEDIRAELDANRSNLDEFDRPYRGIWTGVLKADPVIPVLAYKECKWTAPSSPIDFEAAPMWSVDIAPDHEYSSIAVAGKAVDPARHIAWSLVDHELGTGWVVDRMRDLRDEFGGDRVVLAGNGAAMSLKRALEDEDFEVVVLGQRDIAAACGALFADVVNRKAWFLDDDDLNEAFAGVAKRNSGNAWIWFRGKAMGDISPCYAVTLARYQWLEDPPSSQSVVDTVN